MNLKWIPTNEGMGYFNIQVGFHLPGKTNFDRLMTTPKGKLIAQNNHQLSFINRVLVANQIMLFSMKYLVAYWSPNPHMTYQLRSSVRNYIQGRSFDKKCAKLCWDTLTLFVANKGLRIIDLKAQLEMLLVKFLVKGLSPGPNPQKKFIKHKAEQFQSIGRTNTPYLVDINWFFGMAKFPQSTYSFWRGILGAWTNMDLKNRG